MYNKLFQYYQEGQGNWIFFNDHKNNHCAIGDEDDKNNNDDDLITQVNNTSWAGSAILEI